MNLFFDPVKNFAKNYANNGMNNNQSKEDKLKTQLHHCTYSD